MTHHRPALSWCPRLQTRRGAVFLLTVYFTSLLLLVLTGVALQRTMVETRAAQVSRDVRQAFFLAEGAVDAAMANIRTRSLLESTPYYLARLLGPLTTTRPAATQPYASFTLESLTGGQALSNGRQLVQRRIAATGTTAAPTLTSSGRQAGLTVYYEEVGPVDGIWANGMIIVHGGRQPEPIFATGGMRSARGVLSSMVGAGSVKVPNGSFGSINLGETTSNGVLPLEGAAYVPNLGGLESAFSLELRSIKNGYKCKELFICVGPLDASELWGTPWGNLTFDDPVHIRDPLPDPTIGSVSTANMKYNPPNDPLSIPYTTTASRVEGSLALGTVRKLYPVRLPSSLQSNPACQNPTTLWLPPTGLTIGPNSSYDLITEPEGAQQRITMCVNAIVPQPDPFIANTLVENPPPLTFTAPAQIFVTGAVSVNMNHPFFRVYATGPLADFGRPESNDPITGKPRHSFPASMALPFAGMQFDWAISVGATITTPPGAAVDLVVVRNPNNPNQPPSTRTIVRVKPGQQFVGSIYAPESLVAVGERADPPTQTDPATGQVKVIPYQMKSIVGDEVIVELNKDRVKLGWDATVNAKGPRVNGILGWVDGSTPTPQSTTNVNTPSFGLPPQRACLAGSTSTTCF